MPHIPTHTTLHSMLAKLSSTASRNAAKEAAAISDIFTASVKAEEAVKPEPFVLPPNTRTIAFGAGAKYVAYLSADGSELYVTMTDAEASVDEKTLIEVLAYVNPYRLKTVFVPSLAAIFPKGVDNPLAIWTGDMGRFDLVERDFVVPACFPKGVSTDSILPTTPVANTRYHEHDGKLYLIRDTVYGARIQCQYAVKGKGTAVEWKDCREGVDFAEIEPFAILPLDDAKVRSVALKTLHDAMVDDYVPAAIRADIAKYVIESRIG